MTGEVAWIKPNGEDSNGEVWETHAKVARALRYRLCPFDAYIGPYVDCKEGKLFFGCDDTGSEGYACLWPRGIAPAYCEPIVSETFPLYAGEMTDTLALDSARDVLRRARAQFKREAQS